MGVNIPGGNFGVHQEGVWLVRIFWVGIFPGGNFPDTVKDISIFY